MTKTSYNGTSIAFGDGTDTDRMEIGQFQNVKAYTYQGNISYIALYNRTLTEEEIENQKEWLEYEFNKRKENRQ